VYSILRDNFAVSDGFLRFLLEVLCFRAAHPCVPRVCEHNVLWTAWGNFTEFTSLVQLGQKRTAVKGQGHARPNQMRSKIHS